MCKLGSGFRLAEYPIIFATDQVALIRAGRKTQVRRLISSPLQRVRPGDRLWVQEAFAAVCIRKTDTALVTAKPAEADCAIMRDGWLQPRQGPGHQGPPPNSLGMRLGWFQAVHMPRWASRFDLLVTEVRAELLQTISEADALAEGYAPPMRLWPSARTRFSRAWDQIRGTPGERWEDNPAVMVVSFALCE